MYNNIGLNMIAHSSSFRLSSLVSKRFDNRSATKIIDPYTAETVLQKNSELDGCELSNQAYNNMRDNESCVNRFDIPSL